MKRNYVYLVVCSLITFAAQAAHQNICDAYVAFVSVDTYKQTATVLLEEGLQTPPVDPKLRLPRGSGDGPMPISPARRPGHQVTLDLRDEAQRRVYALLLAARDTATVVDVTFGQAGEIHHVAIHRGPFLARSEGHLTVTELNDMGVAGVNFFLLKNLVTVELNQLGGGCERTFGRCDRAAISLSFDTASAIDARSIETLLSAYGGYSLVDLAFSSRGELTAMRLSGYAAAVARPKAR